MTRTVEQIRETWSKVTPGRWTVITKIGGLGVIVASFGRDRRDVSWFVESSEIVRDEHLPANAEAIAHAPTDIAILLEENQRLTEALKPFAEEANHIPDTHESAETPDPGLITNGDLRRARTALEPAP